MRVSQLSSQGDTQDVSSRSSTLVKAFYGRKTCRIPLGRAPCVYKVSSALPAAFETQLNSFPKRSRRAPFVLFLNPHWQLRGDRKRVYIFPEHASIHSRLKLGTCVAVTAMSALHNNDFSDGSFAGTRARARHDKVVQTSPCRTPRTTQATDSGSVYMADVPSLRRIVKRAVRARMAVFGVALTKGAGVYHPRRRCTYLFRRRWVRYTYHFRPASCDHVHSYGQHLVKQQQRRPGHLANKSVHLLRESLGGMKSAG